MAIEFVCPTCNGTLRVDDGSAGRVIRCGSCLTTLRVPDAAPAPPAPERVVPVAPPANTSEPDPRDETPNPNDYLLHDLDSARPAGRFRDPEPGGPRRERDRDDPYDRPRDRDRDENRPRRRRRPPPPPPGRGALFWVTVIGGLMVLLVFGCCGGLYLLIPGPKWQTHESAKGGFKVDLPAPPRNDLSKLAGGTPDPDMHMEGTILISRAEEFAVVYGDIPVADQQFGNDKARMDEAVNAMKTDGEVRAVLGQKDIIVGGFPAREVEFSAKSGGWFVARVIIADGRVYVLVAGGRFARSGNENARRFLDSFEITDPKLKTVAQKREEEERKLAAERAKREEEERRAERERVHVQKQRDADAAFLHYEHDGPEPGRPIGIADERAEQGFEWLDRNGGTEFRHGTPFAGPGVRGPAWYPTDGTDPGFRASGVSNPDRWNGNPWTVSVNPNGFSVAGWVRVRYVPVTPISVHEAYGAQAPLAEVTVNRTHVTARIAGPNGTVEFKHAWVHDEKWHHVALTRSPTGAQLYFDGAPVASSDAVAPPLPASVGITCGWLRYTDPDWPGPPGVDGKPAKPHAGHVRGAVDECLVIARVMPGAEVARLAGRKALPVAPAPRPVERD